MKPFAPNPFRLAAPGAVGLLLAHSLAVANVLNGGFDETSTSPNQANHWSSLATPPGDVRGGVAGAHA